MQINNSPQFDRTALAGTQGSGALQSPQAATSQTRGSGGIPEDQSELSGVARQITAHQDRLDQLQAAVGKGIYNLPPSVIAQSIIREWMAA